MKKPNDGGPAFPCPGNPTATDDRMFAREGMTLREYYAGQALAGLLASGHFTYPAEEASDDEPGLIRVRGDVYDENGEPTGKKRVHILVVEEAGFLADRMVAEMKEEKDV